MGKSLLRGSLAAALLVAVSAISAQAQSLMPTTLSCADWMSGGYFRCAGAFEGNNKNQDVTGWLSTNWSFATTSTFDVSNGGSTSGTLSLPSVSGVFVLALKAANRFTLYEFDTGGATWTSLAFNTIGTSVNKNGKAQDLSHATVYIGAAPTQPPTTTTPEPVSTTLLATGLIGIGGALRRKRRGTNVVDDA